MSSDRTTRSAVAEVPTLNVADLAELSRRVDALARENEDLGRELLRCYEQLSLVFEITEHIASLRDPKCIQEALLRRYGSMLGASAVFFLRDEDCYRIELGDGAEFAPDIDGPQIRAALADDIAQVRQTGRSRVPPLTPDLERRLQGAHVILGPFRGARESGIAIALRAAGQPAFDSGDMLASESVLGYGGHILSNVLMVRHLQQTAFETVCALANAIDAKDNYTSGHSERVGWLAKFTGHALGVPQSELQMLEWSGLLHDVGKIGVPERILNKPGRLTDEEFAEMKKHPQMSYEVLKPVASLESILDAVLHHHENHDGSGYPHGLRGEEICRAARILHVVDIFDALTSTRSYRRAFSVEKAVRILSEDAGRVTDPEITQVFIAAFQEYMESQPDDFHVRFAHLADEPRAEPAGSGP